MLTIWRLEKQKYAASAFQGRGSLKTDGRWHHQGIQVSYASEHPGVAALEKLVWLESYESVRASSYVLIPLRIVSAKHLSTVSRDALPEDWNAFPHSAATKEVGTRWFEEQQSAVLEVPSAVLPMAKNYLINPFHSDFHELRQGEVQPFTWDARLFKRSREA